MNINKEMIPALKKMCEVVDIDYYDIDFDEDWQTKGKGTPHQLDIFKKWFFNYIISDKKNQRYFLGFTSMTPSTINAFIDEFCEEYWWK